MQMIINKSKVVTLKSIAKKRACCPIRLTATEDLSNFKNEQNRKHKIL